MSPTDNDPGDRRRTESAAPSHGDPEWIGPYHLLDVLGEGGMGVVYLAEQTAPVRRRVALKIIKLGMDTKEVVGRFESERQALAVMDHPNIAQVLDGGATETGRPYFVMELVRGASIVDYADTHKLTTRARLHLFLDVCAAVQHAHQKGVIHRDLKPSNVMVEVGGSRPQVKVIDFGIAKAVGRRLTDTTLVTHVGEMVGTPEYMSPEQAEMSGLDVDTRTDVYALGVILYELMVGALPFDLATRPQSTIPHALREREPPRPSVRLTSLGERGAVVAERRRTSLESLRHELKGDLDWIILKAMDKDRTGRYDTAHGLALDVERYLASEPVLARPPSAGYRVAKFVRRHRGGVLASAVAVAAILVGAGAATVGFVRARRAQVQAQQEAATAHQTSEFLVNLFSVSDPKVARGDTITAREFLDRGARRIETELSGQPVVQARMMRTIGRVYMQLGLYDPARPLLEHSVALDREGKNRGEVVQSLETLGVLDQIQGRFTEAEAELSEALALGRKLYGGADVRVAPLMDGLASLLLRSGHSSDAGPILREALAIYEGAPDPDSAGTVEVLNNLGVMFWNETRYDSAQAYWRRALDIRLKTLPALDPRVADSWNNLGAVYYTLQRYADAATAYEHARAIYQKVLPPDHPKTAQVLNNLAELSWRAGRFTDAEREFLRALAIKRKSQRPHDPVIATTEYGLANVYRDEGKYSRAEPLYRDALTIREAVFGDDNHYTRQVLTDYAALLTRMGRDREAAALRRRAGVTGGDRSVGGGGVAAPARTGTRDTTGAGEGRS